jgi:hypothetical protein
LRALNAKAVEFFDAEQVPVNSGSDRQADLVLQGLDFDRERPGSVPDGFKLRNEPDGSTSVTDQRGSVQGSIPKGASVAGKEQAVVGAVAKRSADGLISSRGRVLPAASPVLAQTAKMVRGFRQRSKQQPRVARQYLREAGARV